jgi:hypothetical protein
VPRRVSLPGAAELFRPTRPAEDSGPNGHPPPQGSGRMRHDEKITVYVSAEELLALEQARLFLRAEYGLAVDRGRIVREAISALLADLAGAGEDSELIRRLSSRPA